MKLNEEGKIEIHKKQVINYFKYSYSSNSVPKTDLLTADELKLIDGVVENLIEKCFSADFPWRLAKVKQ